MLGGIGCCSSATAAAAGAGGGVAAGAGAGAGGGAAAGAGAGAGAFAVGGAPAGGGAAGGAVGPVATVVAASASVPCANASRPATESPTVPAAASTTARRERVIVGMATTIKIASGAPRVRCPQPQQTYGLGRTPASEPCRSFTVCAPTAGRLRRLRCGCPSVAARRAPAYPACPCQSKQISAHG
jgi:hypothetical protein